MCDLDFTEFHRFGQSAYGRINEEMELHARYRFAQHSRAGLTLLELLLFVGIFAVLAIIFTGILISITNVYVKESGAARVSEQSDFLLRKIQGYVEESSAIHDDMVNGVPTNVLKLYTQGQEELVEIYAGSDGIVYIKKTDTDVQSPVPVIEPLTDERTVKINSADLVFTRFQSSDAKDFISFRFSMSLRTSNPLRMFTQHIQGGISRVSAATFDSSLYPSGQNLRIGGLGNQRWDNINEILYFQGRNVGIHKVPNSGEGDSDPRLEINGPMNLTAVASGTVACVRGTIYLSSFAGVQDQLRICVGDGFGGTSWKKASLINL